MASVRIGQTSEFREFDIPDFSLTRGTTLVPTQGIVTLVYMAGLVFVGGRIIPTGTIPATGNWSITIAALSTYASQGIGRLHVLDGASVDMQLASGLITFPVQPVIATGNVLTIQGMVV